MAVVHNPATYSMDTGFFFPGLKRPGHEVEHSLPSSNGFTNKWRLPQLPQYIFVS